jgi:calcium-dependent protein kinase
LGKGRYGVVTRGIHKKTQTQVAIKIIAKQNLTQNSESSIRSEIEILKISQHPNIIRLYNTFENPNYIYISNILIKNQVMEFCKGNDLFSYFEARKFKISENRAAQIIHKLATALYFLHEYNVVHRDLKPENILMTSNEEDADIRLLDFGLSKILNPGEKCVLPVGTLVQFFLYFSAMLLLKFF